MYSYLLECVRNAIEFKLELKVKQMNKELIYCRLYNKLEEKFLTQNSDESTLLEWTIGIRSLHRKIKYIENT